MRLWLHLCTNTHQAVLHFKMTFLREKMVKSAITFRGAWAYLPHWGLEPVVCDSSQCNVRPTLTFPAVGHHHPLASTNSYCLVTEARVWTTCLRLLPYSGTDGSRTCNFSTNAVTITLPCHMTKAFCHFRHSHRFTSYNLRSTNTDSVPLCHSPSETLGPVTECCGCYEGIQNRADGDQKQPCQASVDASSQGTQAPSPR